ncbi:restriction endonuclease subunit S [Limosilactobacillus reuteri subsp. suis]
MKYRLGDLLYIKGRIGWKGLKKKEYLDKGDYRIINGTNIINGKVNWSSCGFISKERYNESPEIMLKANDILITKDGTIGKVAIVEELSKPSTVASGIFILRNTSPNIWITKYLYYYLQSYDFKSFIHSRIEGSVIPHLYQKDFESLSIKSPSLEEQNTISRRLELIDKKIDLNNQLNDNLVA